MDNFRIDITCEGQDALRKVMEIAFAQHRAATHYAIRPAGDGKPRRLVFMWTGGGADAVEMPFKLDAIAATDFATRWLAEQDYGKEPDHDGDNSKGWRAYNEAWGHVDEEWRGFLAVAPAWAMHGK